MTASVYLAAMGPEGLRRAAESSASHAHYLAQRLSELPGFALKTDRPFFHEFLTECPIDPELFCRKLEEKGHSARPAGGGRHSVVLHRIEPQAPD